jgi:hypothetical protein
MYDFLSFISRILVNLDIFLFLIKGIITLTSVFLIPLKESQELESDSSIAFSF